MAMPAPAVHPAPRQEGPELFAERERIERKARIRQLVFGSLDGLLVPLGVVTGVAAGTGSSTAVIVAGLAEAFAGALSMGAGEFIADRAEAQVQRAEIQREAHEIATEPAAEQQEMARLWAHEGVAGTDADRLATTLAKYPPAFGKTMVEKELGIPFAPQTVNVPGAITMGASYIIASLFPLIAYFFLPVARAVPVSLGLTLVALVLVGVIKGRLAQLNLLRSVLEIILVGAASAGGGYLLGTLVPRWLGL
jgi:VIT1/CCC1 family predicted Fe2+/Mn2+ transporter